MGIEQAFVYIILCTDGTLYCGWTNDPKKRFKAHCAGTGAIYTRVHTPLKMVCLVRCKDKRDALSLEFHVKHNSRKKKLALIDSDKNLLRGKELEALDL